MIDLKNIDVVFKNDKKQTLACTNVSLFIETQDIYGIVGYSGAGKSTLVRCINLLQRPSSGKVFVEGVDMLKLSKKELRLKRKEIGMIFQHFNLMGQRNVFENVYYPIRKLKISKEEKEERINKLLELVDIADKKNAYPSQLSGGQKQRVAIARALATEPKILLCDEATSALDPKTTHSILMLLKELNKKLGLTIVLITHEMQAVKEICNKCAVMENGKILESGKTIDIFSNPREKLTKDFINTALNKNNISEKLSHSFNNQKIYSLDFKGDITHSSFILDLYKKFGVDTSILYGNIEYISNVPLGNLVVTMAGSDENIEKACQYIRANDIGVEVVNV